MPSQNYSTMRKFQNLRSFPVARVSYLLIGITSLAPGWAFAVPVDELVAPQMATAEPFVKTTNADRVEISLLIV